MTSFDFVRKALSSPVEALGDRTSSFPCRLVTFEVTLVPFLGRCSLFLGWRRQLRQDEDLNPES